MNLQERQKNYESFSDYSLTPRLPVIIRVDGKNFSNITRKCDKPYDPIIQAALVDAAAFAISDMQGAVFAYTQSDEITFILRNDQSLESTPWFQNRLLKISSITSSLVTLAFNNFLNLKGVSLAGPALFDCRVFVVPSITEAVNNIIYRQGDCVKNSVSSAAQNLLTQKLGTSIALKSLFKKKTDEKRKLVKEVCNIDFDEYFPSSFRHGVGIYKVPTLINKENNIIRNKWFKDWDLPLFIENKPFISNLIINGFDNSKSFELLGGEK